jgi:hypothetical protein
VVIEGNGAQVNDQHNPVTQVLEAYRNAVSARDAEAFMALSGTAPGWPQVSYNGTAGWASTNYLN